ncbi:FAD-dependent oxidoreductase [Gordonia amarae]|uniref:Glycerol-3-phosphate dehydrogenase n=3 Tax=Gordonia amarae TaxID=36821 RepID=A0A857M8W1_9ACTN|nr:glycerol-3-phosphate dehydrogenase/oxidase [Gordonia amarae]MCS3876789.1 glycerol-3-phosphate dehydrogenase [Gordonia amarae]QHN15634.1 FAD-dependent oxidoreductase [Gordonia amarae]QHN20203.1 FAD-dependent oxidoreductase [Gordonia amarae]QHN29054.1 FAD-dependent oxidoreductase [Gordonia amarae]QHN37835.1 FAD-dependent oxidoreductase [Gordonia amarae]
MTTSLNAARRRADLAALADRESPLDLLVIGGGVTGAGVALDAASRGLRVALVEANDLAFGTSRWSNKLLHSGLSYLTTGHLPMVLECARERRILMTAIAPHLVSPLRHVYPLYGPEPRAMRVRLGTSLAKGLRKASGTPYELMPPPARIDALDTIRLFPEVRREGLRGARSSVDGQLVDDARLVVGLARTAAAFGASVCTCTRAENVTDYGARLVDTLTGEGFDVYARTVVNAAGRWAEGIDREAVLEQGGGTHLVVDAARLGNPVAGLSVPLGETASDLVSILPAQLGRAYIGFTRGDFPAVGSVESQRSSSDIDVLLSVVNTALQVPLTPADILGTFPGGSDLADPTRRHRIRLSGTMVSVVGGTLTTYRRRAQETVDAAITVGDLAAGPCITETTPLIGASGFAPHNSLPASAFARYGSETAAVFERATVAAPHDQIAPGIDVTRAEIEFAVRHEGALCVDDVLDRRTRIGLVAADADAARHAVTDIVTETLAAL